MAEMLQYCEKKEKRKSFSRESFMKGICGGFIGKWEFISIQFRFKIWKELNYFPRKKTFSMIYRNADITIYVWFIHFAVVVDLLRFYFD